MAINNTDFDEDLKIITNPKYYKPIPSPNKNDWLACHEEKGQSFEEWVQSNRNVVDDKGKRTNYLVPLGEDWSDHVGLLKSIEEYATVFFEGMKVCVLEPVSLADKNITSRENSQSYEEQYLAGDLMRLLEKMLPDDGYCITGILMKDLYPRESWNFVFGMASLQNRTGVYSFRRYDPDFYGYKRTEDYKTTILKRSCKVMTHEICHQFGMRHCIYFSCLMNGSNHLEESDKRPFSLCPTCYKKLFYAINGDNPANNHLNILKRETNILHFLEKNKFGEAEVTWYKNLVSSMRNANPINPKKSSIKKT